MAPIFYCNSVKVLIDRFCREMLDGLELDDDNKILNFLFLGSMPNGTYNSFIFISAVNILFYIWRMKLKKGDHLIIQ